MQFTVKVLLKLDSNSSFLLEYGHKTDRRMAFFKINYILSKTRDT